MHTRETQVLHAILDNLTEFVVRWRPNGIRTYVNKAYCDYYQLTKSQALGSSFFPHIAEADLNKVKQRISGLSFDHPSSTDVHRVLRPDGSIGWQEWTDTALFDENRALIEYQSVGRDVSQRMQAELEMLAHGEHLEKLVAERTQELLTANRELESFSYTVSHDLHAPLRSLNGVCAMLLEDYGEQLDEPVQAQLHKIVTLVDRMSRLIDTLLMLSQVSRMQLMKQTINISDIILSIAKQLQNTHPDRNVRLSVQEYIMGEADPQLLQIALANLLENAWKYTRKNPDAEIRVGTEIIDNQRVYYVADNGVGFDLQQADKLFQAFQRLHSTDDFQGSGIGLATVNRIIQRHGGRIWAEAQVNEGATFYFTLG